MDSLIEKIVILVGSVVAAYFLGKHTQKKDTLIDKWEGKVKSKEQEDEAKKHATLRVRNNFSELLDKYIRKP